MVKVAQLKQSSREQLKGNWPIAVIFFLIFFNLINIASYIQNQETIFYFIISTAILIISGPLTLAVNRFLLKLINKEKGLSLLDLFDFKDVLFKSILIRLVTTMLISLGTIFFIIPGILVAIYTSQALYILAENPDKQPLECIILSKDIMKGNALKYIYTGLSFIGWAIVGALTLGVAYLWLVPYFHLTLANFYVSIKNN